MRSSWSSRIGRPWTVVQDQLRTVHIPHSTDERGRIHTSACMLTHTTYQLVCLLALHTTYYIASMLDHHPHTSASMLAQFQQASRP